VGGRQLVAVEDDVDLPDTEEIREAIPGALDELGAYAEAAGEVGGEVDLEAGDDGGLVVAGEDVGAAALLIAAPPEHAAAADLVQVIGPGRRGREERREDEGDSGETEARHGAHGMEPTSEKRG
jgi:hypothetical protein